MPRDWDAATYDRIADPMFRWGAVVAGRLDLAGDETVLDAGCGSGRVTEVLLERLPRGRVVALDGSPSMIEQARRRLRRSGDRVEFLVADLVRPLPIADSVDAILSTATFHWIRELGRDPLGSKRYATPEETAARLERAGFVDVECWLHPEPTPFETVDDLETYLSTIILRDHVEGMAPDEARAFVHEVAARMPRLEIDYVRLNIGARGGGERRGRHPLR